MPKSYKSKPRNKANLHDKSNAIDLVIRLLAFGTITGTMLVAPNAIQFLDKPLNSLLDGLDDREKRRKLSKIKSYMKTQGLVSDDYDHGLILTKKAIRRLEKINFNELHIPTPDKWDKNWRIVMFDIPNQNNYARQMFTDKVKELGMQLLQQSVWIHPYPCQEELSKVGLYLGVDKLLTYIETSHIDNEEKLIYRFKQTGVL